jgi:phosphate transport system substrate-binding protein
MAADHLQYRFCDGPGDGAGGRSSSSELDHVDGYSNSGNALGYSVYYYLANMYAVPGIKMLGISSMQPSTKTITNGTYPYGNDFCAVVRADAAADSPERKVLARLLSDVGARAVTDAGDVPLG